MVSLRLGKIKDASKIICPINGNRMKGCKNEPGWLFLNRASYSSWKIKPEFPPPHSRQPSSEARKMKSGKNLFTADV